MKRLLLPKWSFLIALLLTASVGFAQTSKQRQDISRSYDQQKLSLLETQLAQKALAQKEQALAAAKIYGWQERIEYPDGTIAILHHLDDEGNPVYYGTRNNGAATTARADRLYTGGSLGLDLNGENMTVAVWDGGAIRHSHESFSGRSVQKDGATGISDHANHVTGTMIGSDVPNNGSRGMAYKANCWNYDTNNDIAEAVGAAADGILVSNHSYGPIIVNQFGQVVAADYMIGKYSQQSKDWDEVQYNAPYYLHVNACGNDRGFANTINGKGGYDLLIGISTAKNSMMVGAVNGVDNYTGPSDVVMSNFSSWGPTDDGRIKPDIVGKGVSVYSATSGSNTSYGNKSGTSMSSPSVAGTLILLQQHYNNVNGNFMRAATLKGLALHTADEAGDTPGPDYEFGWGLINAERAANAITNNNTSAIISEEALAQGQTITRTVTASGTEPLMVSISWTDPAGQILENIVDLSTPALVNDLDIRITKDGTTYFPWKLDVANPSAGAIKGDNLVDNIEKIQVDGALGDYTITITHKGTLTDGVQNFALIATGVTAEPIVCNATTPQNVVVSNIDSDKATVSWGKVDGAAYDVRYRAVGTTAWTTNAVSGVSTTVEGLSPETQYEVQVASKCGDGSSSAFSASTNFTTTEVVLVYCASKGNNVNDEFIGNVKIGSIDNASGSGNGYTDFTSLSTVLTKGVSNTITVTPTWTGTVYSEGYSVWIDYNHDGDFADAGEQVWTQSATQSTPVSGSFTVPQSATETATRMRVSMKYNGVPSPCETFSYGEVEDYTVVIAAPVPDNEAPSAPTALAASNVTDTTVDLSWTASTDNVGVSEYDVYQGGTLVTSTANTSASISGLTAETAYSFSVQAKDFAGNVSASSNTVNVTTTATPIVTDVVLTEGFFESGWDGWSDGGSDCYRYSGSRSAEGNYSIRLRDNSGTASAMTSQTFDVSSYDQIEITFKFYVYSLESGEDFWVRFYNGSSWQTVKTYTRGVDIENNNFYDGTVVINKSQYNFASNAQFRIQCDASGNADQVYIDAVKIVASNGASTRSDNIEYLGSLEEISSDELSDELFSVYPNPAENVISVKRAGNQKLAYEIYDLVGKRVANGILEDTIDVTSLKQGVYLIRLDDGEEVITQKFIKK